MSENSIEDFSKKIPKAKYKNRHKLSPKWLFILIISGHSGGGKTNLLLNLIFKYLHFNRLYVYARNLNEPYYEYLQEIDSELRESLGDKYDDYFKFYNSLDDVAPLEALDISKQNLVVFDTLLMRRIKARYVITSQWVENIIVLLYIFPKAIIVFPEK